MRRENNRAGFTVIELMIAMALLAIVLVKLTLVINEATKTHSKESNSLALEDQVQRVLDRISFAIIGADPDTLFPSTEFPLFQNQVQYRVSLGVEDGEVVWSNPEVIRLGESQSQLVWGENVGTADERVVVWCNTVSEFMEEEVLNGWDDNENGLTDESGLTFVLDGKSVTIRLTLERVDKDGTEVQMTRETTVTCRN